MWRAHLEPRCIPKNGCEILLDLPEANVLNGKLIMTSMDITSQPEKRIVARQMHKADS